MSLVRVLTSVLDYLLAPQLWLGVLLFALMAIRGSIGGSDDNSSLHSSQQSEDDFNDVKDDEEVAQTPPKRKGKRARLKMEDGESSHDIADTAAKDHQCRFCPMKFGKSQALGGHMNRHRTEREQEDVRKARDLLTNRDQYYGATAWNMQGSGAGLNPPAAGTFAKPCFAPGQSAAPPQNWQMAPLSSLQQSSAYGFQSAPLPSGGSYYNIHQQDAVRPLQAPPSQRQAIGQHLPVHQQFRVIPGQQHNIVQQQNMAQQLGYSESKPVLQSGADIAEPQQSAFSSDQAGPSTSHLQDIVNMSSNVQFVESCWNFPAHFQQGQGQGHNFQEQQQYTSYDQKLGTSVMGIIGSDTHNQASGSGIRHMQSFQDSTGDQDPYQGGDDQSAPAAEAGNAGLEESPDISSAGR